MASKLCSAWFLLLNMWWHQIHAIRVTQKVFAEVESINYLDIQTNGVLFILNEQFIKSYLQDSQVPTLYATCIPLNRKHARVTRVMYPETMNNGKIVSMSGLQQSAWYYACLEFESLNRQNETTGCHCRLFRTLDKFGRTYDSPLISVAPAPESSDGDHRLTIDFELDLDHDSTMTFFFSSSSDVVVPPSKLFVLDPSRKSLKVTFDGLRPATEYGHVCVVQEPAPSRSLYTAMGRLINTKQQKCFGQTFTTEQEETKKSKIQPIDYQIGEEEEEEDFGYAPPSPPMSQQQQRRPPRDMASSAAKAVLVYYSAVASLTFLVRYSAKLYSVQ